jgi:hypothetical protein
MKVWFPVLKSAIIAVVIACSATCAVAASKRGADLTLQQLAKNSEEVVIGKVKDKKTRAAGRHFETDYEVEVTEHLKGKSLSTGKSVQMTVPGGVLTTPPLTQFVQYQPHMFVGEEVALFLKTSPVNLPAHVKASAAANSKLATTPRVVGMNQGKFSVLTDEVDGKKKIVRLNLEDYAMVPGDEAAERTLKALARHELRTTTAPVVQLSIPKSGAESRDPLEVTNSTNPATYEKRASAVEAAKRIKARGAVPVQDLQEFKDQVRMFAE